MPKEEFQRANDAALSLQLRVSLQRFRLAYLRLRLEGEAHPSAFGQLAGHSNNVSFNKTAKTLSNGRDFEILMETDRALDEALLWSHGLFQIRHISSNLLGAE